MSLGLFQTQPLAVRQLVAGGEQPEPEQVLFERGPVSGAERGDWYESSQQSRFVS